MRIGISVVTAVVLFFATPHVVSACDECVSCCKNGAKGPLIGSVALVDSHYDLLIKPKLDNLPPGIHCFHIHLYSLIAAVMAKRLAAI